jgi:hypothetical protein
MSTVHAPEAIALPRPRGPVSEFLVESLRGPVATLPAAPEWEGGDPFADEDLHLSLFLSYELHYRGVVGVDEGWEWEPSLLALRRELERPFEEALAGARVPGDAGVDPAEMDLALRAIGDADDSPSVSRHLERHGTIEEWREFAIHRSVYQLKEADPHSWAIPRLTGVPKAALVEIQADEYGGGVAHRIHSQLFADSMEALELDPSYGAYLDRVPGFTLSTVNLMSFFGLHRRWRGAAMGHLALYEMGSAVPNRRYGNGLRRLGYGAEATYFFDEHAEADAVHDNIAAVDLAGGLARQQPGMAGDVLFGARALLLVDAGWAPRVLGAWADGRSSLLDPQGAAAAA